MGNFNRGGFGGGRGRSFGNKRDFRDRGPRQMYKAVCSRCGKECEVPFHPTGEKPVYCQDCFREIQGSERNNDRNFSKPRFENRREESGVSQEEFAKLNEKLDRILSMLQNTSSPKVEEASIAPEKKKRSPKKSS